jgi:hypothetical protein
MANEFKIRNGYLSTGDSQVTGSLTVTNGITGSLFGTASFATSASFAPSTPTFPYTGSAIISGSLEITGSFSVNNGTNVKLDTATSTLTDDNNNSSIDWQTRLLEDVSGNVSIDWTGRQAIDVSGNLSIDWDNRQLKDLQNLRIIDYSGVTGYNIRNYRPTVEVLPSESLEEFTQQPGSLGTYAANFAGSIIGVGPNIDLAVTTSNTVFLDSDGSWKQVNQSTDNTTKLLGVCIDNSGAALVLTEGTITVTTSSAVPNVPNVKGTSFYGMPVYLTGSQSSLTTTKPTSGYVRVVGHMYYNSTTTPDYWIMKFNPSNDWYEI